MPTLWRVVKEEHAATAFDGKAAQRYGGRWNPVGVPAVYASGSKSLALLEVLVHLDAAAISLAMVSFRFEVNQAAIATLPAARLPRGWRTSRGWLATQQLGADFLTAGKMLALAVPSAIVPEEWNYLLNPQHSDFAALKIGKPTTFALDSRLA